jgi:hypothetical protein
MKEVVTYLLLEPRRRVEEEHRLTRYDAAHEAGEALQASVELSAGSTVSVGPPNAHASFHSHSPIRIASSFVGRASVT